MKPVPFTLNSHSKSKLYFQLYQNLVNAIRKGYYAADEKLPSVRQLSTGLSVSKNTVITAYRLLSDEGYIISRNKSGFMVNRNHSETKEKSYYTDEDEFEIPTVDAIFKEREGTEVQKIPVPDELLEHTQQTESVPAPVESVPTPAESVPTPDESVPAPTESVPAPTESVPSPAESVPTPAESVPTPAESVPAPAESAPNPAESVPTPAESVPPASDEQTTATPSESDSEEIVSVSISIEELEKVSRTKPLSPQITSVPVDRSKIIPQETKDSIQEKSAAENEIKSVTISQKEVDSVINKNTDPFGEKFLRRTIAFFLYNNFEISCTSAQIIVSDKMGSLLENILKLISPPPAPVKTSGKGLLQRALEKKENTTQPKQTICVSETASEYFSDAIKNAGWEIKTLPVAGTCLETDSLFEGNSNFIIVVPSEETKTDYDELFAWSGEKENHYIIEYHPDLPDETIYPLCCDNNSKVILISTLCDAAFVVLPSSLLNSYKNAYQSETNPISTDDQKKIDQMINQINKSSEE